MDSCSCLVFAATLQRHCQNFAPLRFQTCCVSASSRVPCVVHSGASSLGLTSRSVRLVGKKKGRLGPTRLPWPDSFAPRKRKKSKTKTSALWLVGKTKGPRKDQKDQKGELILGKIIDMYLRSVSSKASRISTRQLSSSLDAAWTRGK